MKMLQVEDCGLAREHNISLSEFKVSYGWVRCFMARHDLTIRRRTMIAQRLPEACDETLVSFQKYVLKLRKRHEYLFFDMPESTTVNSVGERTVQIIRTMGAEKQRCTIMLAITADGQKLPPYVVFKCKTMAKEKFPQGIIIRVQESDWMIEDLVDDWSKSVWFR
jgi:hypothetical protein